MSDFNIINILLNQIKEDSHYKKIMQIFADKPFNTRINKGDIEKKFGLECALKDIDFIKIKENPSITNNELFYNEIIKCADLLPGDLQRVLRSFFDKYKIYGLCKEEKKDKKKDDRKSIMYYWKSISKEEYEEIAGIKIPDRNIFKNDNDRKLFIQSKGNKCEICNNTERLSIDHWRSFSKYNIDSTEIAVVLCEKCNNIHHNNDASNIIIKNSYSLNIINNWVNIETNIRKNGYLPMDEDIILQNKNIDFVCKNLKEKHNMDNTSIYKSLINLKL